MLAACLSQWNPFVRRLHGGSAEEQPLSLEEVMALLIHRAYLRKRRTERSRSARTIGSADWSPARASR
jgi:hypothetical protein